MPERIDTRRITICLGKQYKQKQQRPLGEPLSRGISLRLTVCGVSDAGIA
jgi:hypothetical protein